MTIEKMKDLKQIKDDLFALYPNAVKIQFVAEGDKVTVTPTEKYEISDDFNDENEEE
ncbi:hypothetical protein NV379_02570 [Paenibacillus sp. N1-5-1-14]|uniref:hypothetical protein n=1 Tax=Paenibacillus radicibacter TaxID=2972488 RepID=UPI00215936E6|nr:hypothetical protein [Paenibacillus radicibacter]MCR8641531.1 hypothetical protein [Paenibacillus radicibacter]